MSVKISIITAIYNVNKYLVNKYLDRYFLSLVSMLENINHEIILVNDCSLEEPINIINKYKGKLNIKYKYLARNGGLGNARIEGYRMISNNSTHFTIIDPDDSVCENFRLSNHLKLMQKFDFILFATKIYINNKYSSTRKPSLSFFIARRYGFRHIAGGLVIGTIFKCDKKILSLIEDKSRYYEDLIPANIIGNSKDFKSTKINLHFLKYYIRDDSISNSVHSYEQHVIHAQNVRKLFELKILPPKIEKRLISYMNTKILITSLQKL